MRHKPWICACAGVLAAVLPYGPALAEHCILLAGLAPARRLGQHALLPDEVASLLGAVRIWETWLDACETHAPEGFITLAGMINLLPCLGLTSLKYRLLTHGLNDPLYPRRMPTHIPGTVVVLI